MPINNFRTPDGDIENESFITESWLVDQWIGDQLWVWGRNQGTLGINNIELLRSTPVTTLAGGTDWKQVSFNGSQSAAIKTDGSLWIWGSNYNGALGTNNTIARSTPVTTFAGGFNWKQVSIGVVNHSAAIKTDGTLWTWGETGEGQLGINIGTPVFGRSTPVTTFAGGNDWKQVSCGNQHVAAVKTDGTLWLWGRNDGGQLGANITISRSTPITTFAGGNDWKQVACGDYHTAAIKTDGSLWTWGLNTYGNMGINFRLVDISTPTTTFAGGNNWKQVACGFNFTAAIKTDGTLWVWGRNSYGQLGTNDSRERSTPVTTFAGGNNWKQVECGYEYTAAIKTDGTLWSWGRNSSISLGINQQGVRSTPVTTFAGGNNWKQVSCAGDRTGAIASGPEY